MQIVKDHYKNDQNRPLACTYYYPDDFDPKHPRPAVVVNHGIGGNQNAEYVIKSMKPITDRGAIGISANLRGAGGLKINTKELTSKNTQSDLNYAARHFAANKHIIANKMVNISCSWTTYNSMQNAVNPNCVKFCAHVLHSMVAAPMEAFGDLMTKKNMLLWQMFKYFPVAIDGNKCHIPYEIHQEAQKINLITDVAPKIIESVTVIQGEKDTIGFCSTAQKFFENLPPEYQMNFHILKDAPHGFVGNDLEMAILFSDQAVMAAIPELHHYQNMYKMSGEQRKNSAA